MDFIKRNTGFFASCIVLLLASIILIVLIFIDVGKLNKAKKQVASAGDQIKSLMYATPAPTNKNVKAAQTNREELQERLTQVYQELQKGAYLKTRDDGVSVISSILRYISDYKKRVDNHVNANSEQVKIIVPKQFAFGFEDYIGSTLIPEGKVVPELDKQRQILSYILDQLIDADPTGIQAVRREDLENPTSSKGFQIDPAISARVPNAIDTLAFQVVFTGYTPSLRRFLNNLAYFELPVVVRSVEVDRLDSESGDNVEEIFKAMVDTDKNDSKIPVISEIESIFTVTLEFIEVIAPNDTEGEVL